MAEADALREQPDAVYPGYFGELARAKALAFRGLEPVAVDSTDSRVVYRAGPAGPVTAQVVVERGSEPRSWMVVEGFWQLDEGICDRLTALREQSRPSRSPGEVQTGGPSTPPRRGT